MLPDRVSNPGPLTYESGALPIALRGPALSVSRQYSTKVATLEFHDYSCFVVLDKASNGPIRRFSVYCRCSSKLATTKIQYNFNGSNTFEP